MARKPVMHRDIVVVKVEHMVKHADLGELLVRLVSTPLTRHEVPKPSGRLLEEVKVMREVRGVHSDPQDTGRPSLFSCPDRGEWCRPGAWHPAR